MDQNKIIDFRWVGISWALQESKDLVGVYSIVAPKINMAWFLFHCFLILLA
jgi:hypothetical protein